MEYIYALITIDCPGKSNVIVTDDTRHLGDDAVMKLNDLKVQWIHEYYWPGDNYYAFVRFAKNDKEMIDKLQGIGKLEIRHPTYTPTSKNNKISLEESFNKKYQT